MARILIVDDSRTEIHAFTRMLQKHGHETLVAENGQQGLEIARADRPDLILMDIVMPEMDGFQATRQLQRSAETNQIPIIMISTKSQESDRVWAMRQGASSYLVKPMEEDSLIKEINTLLGTR